MYRLYEYAKLKNMPRAIEREECFLSWSYRADGEKAAAAFTRV